MDDSDTNDRTRLNEKNTLITKIFIEELLKRYGIDYTVNNINKFYESTTHLTYTKTSVSFNKNNKISKYLNSKLKNDVNDGICINLSTVIDLKKISYERLEFLGDSVIHLILAAYLYERYDICDEGFMTKLRTKIEDSGTLANFSKTIGLNKYVLMSQQMEKINSRDKNLHMLEDVFEAFIGALYCDAGFQVCNKFIIALIEDEIDFTELLCTENNYKDILLRYYHKQKWIDPSYDTLNIIGPDNKKQFVMCVTYKADPDDVGKVVGKGKGRSKKKAEQEAAKNALMFYGVLKKKVDIIVNENDLSEEVSYETMNDSSIEIIDDDDNDGINYVLEDIQEINTSVKLPIPSFTNIIEEDDRVDIDINISSIATSVITNESKELNKDSDTLTDTRTDSNLDLNINSTMIIGTNIDNDINDDDNIDDNNIKYICNVCNKIYIKKYYYEKHIEKCK